MSKLKFKIINIVIIITILTSQNIIYAANAPHKEDETTTSPSCKKKQRSPNHSALSTVRVKVPKSVEYIEHIKIKIEQKIRTVHGIAGVVADITDHRLTSNIIAGMGAGEEQFVNRGAWVRMFYGRSNFSGKIAHGIVATPHSMKNSLSGITLSVDHQPSEDLIGGLALGYTTNDSQFKINDQQDDFEELGMVTGSVYIHNMITSQLSINNNISYGRYGIKVKNKELEHHGGIFRAMAKSHYKLHTNEYVTSIPNLELNFSRLSLERLNDESLKTEKLILKQAIINAGWKAISSYQWRNLTIAPEVNIGYSYLLLHWDNDLKIRDIGGRLVLNDKIDSNHILKLGADLNILTNQGRIIIGVEHSRHGDNKTNLVHFKLRFKL